MGFKAIKQHYDIGYIVAIYNEEKYGGDCICIGSGFVHGLIAINIETGKVFERDEEIEWQCRNCGYVLKGKKAPMKCPACEHPQAYFEPKKNNY